MSDELKPEVKEEVKAEEVKMDPKQHEMLLEIMKKKSDNKDLKSDNETLLAKIADMEKTAKTADEEKAKQAGDFQELWVKEQERNNQLIEANNLLKKKIEDEQETVAKIAKMYAVEEKIQFARPAYKAMFPINEVKIDNGRLDAESLDKAVEVFKQNHPELIRSNANVVNPTGIAPVKNDAANVAKPMSKQEEAMKIANLMMNLK